MADAAPNEKLGALLKEHQQLLQQQVHQQMKTLLDQHTVAITATLEKNFGSTFQKEIPLHTADADATATQEEATATATAAAAKTATANTDPAPISDKKASAPPRKKAKHQRTHLSDFSEEKTDGRASSLREAVSRFMHGRIATGTIAFAILTNTIVMYVQLQWLGSKADASLGLDNNVGSWGSAEEVFNVFEFVFATFFLLEFLLNVYAFRLEYFTNAINVMDSIIVLITSLEIFVLQMLSLNMGNISFLRVLRFAKFARALRVVRTMRSFSKLRILLSTIAYSMGSFFWSMVLLFLLMLMGAIFLCQMLHDFVTDEGADLATRTWVNDKFGSGNKALYTFFEITFSGGWPNNASKVVKDVNPFYVIFFAVYITFVVFGMLRIISALFLSETMQQANRDAEIMVWHSAQKGKKLRREIEELFDVADTSGDGLLSLEELGELLSHEKVRAWLTELGINPTDTHMLFDLLADEEGQVDKAHFLAGITKLKGEARAQDLIPVATNCQRILAHCKVLRHYMETIQATHANV